MSDDDLVLNFAHSLEITLHECFGVSKGSLGKQVQEVRCLIPKSLYRNLIKIVEVRNRVIHRREPLLSSNEFRRDCEEALSDLQFIFALTSGVIVLLDANNQRLQKRGRQNGEKTIIPVGESRITEISERQSSPKSTRLLTDDFDRIETALQNEMATNGSVAGLRTLMNQHRGKINPETMKDFENRFATLGLMVANSILRSEILDALTKEIPSIASAKGHWKRIQEAEKVLSQFGLMSMDLQADSRKAIMRLALFRYCKEIKNAEREVRLGSKKKESGHRTRAIEMLREDWPVFMGDTPIPDEPMMYCDSPSFSIS